MDRVILHPDGRLLSDPPQADPLAMLGHAVELADGCLLGCFPAMIERHPDLRRLSPFLPDLVEACVGWTPKPPDPPDGLERLQIVKTLEMIGAPGEPRLESYVSLIGLFWGAETVIKVYPVEALLRTPLSLGKLTHKVFGDAYADMAFATTFTLFEVIQALAWQLAFHAVHGRRGGPMECAISQV